MSSSVNADARANTHSRMKYDGNETSLPVAALHAFESRRNSGTLVKKIRMMPTSGLPQAKQEDKWPAQTKSRPEIASAVRFALSIRGDTGP